MSSLSIRRMNFTLQEMEHERARQTTKWYASLPEDMKADRTHYWHVERKAKRGRKWIFVCEYFGTKSDVAAFWRKSFMGKAGYRLHHLMSY